MKLDRFTLQQASSLVSQDFILPQFDIASVKADTLAAPIWLQLGAGNIFRAFLAADVQHLLNSGEMAKGVLVAEGYDYEIVDRLQAFDNLTVNVTLKGDGQVSREIIASIADYYKMDPQMADFKVLKAIFQSASLQMISLTITEKGYSLVDGQGALLSAVAADFQNGPENVTSYLGKLCALLVERFNAGAYPVALVSLDNMSHNGEKLQAAISRFAQEWAQKGFVSEAFVHYLTDGDKVSFPWSMIDKITPRPDASVAKLLTEAGLEEMAAQETKKHTFVAPYVNGEETQYLVIEDDFPNGRPPLEQAGVIFTDRRTVNLVETMKVTTCLNPLHTTLAIFGCLLGYHSIHEEMKDQDLVALISQLGYQEGLPVVVDPQILDPKQFLDEVIQVRFPNPFIPDTPQRIATDTSQKLSVRFGETVKAYLKSDTLDVANLQVIPLVYAGWLRYLTGVDDEGQVMPLSPDPLLGRLTPLFADFSLGAHSNREVLWDLLQEEKIFGVNLVEVGLADKVLTLFYQMSKAPGAVRQQIQQTIA